jgi:uncharacterized protein
MTTIPITRDQAWELITKYNTEKSDLNHYLESEAVMKAVANKIGEDPEYYGMLGLIHDIDWGITKNNPQNHLTKAPEILKEAGFDDNFIEIILSHGYGFDCANLLEKSRSEITQFALASSETITGLIHAYALMRPIDSMTSSKLNKKFKDKTFASAVRRDVILECEKIPIPKEVFFTLAIEAIKSIKHSVSLE